MAIAGNVWVLSSVFSHAITKVPTDPAGTITLTIKAPSLTDPSGYTTTVEVFGQPSGVNIIHDGPGTYHRDLVCPIAGAYVARWNAGPGDGEAADQVRWPVGRTFD